MEEQNQDFNISGTINQADDSFEPGPAPVAKPKDKKKLILGIAVGLLAIVVGMGIVFATGLWDPVWNPLRPSPDKIVMEALKNISEIDSLRAKVKIGIDVTGSPEGDTKVALGIDAVEDNLDAENRKGQFLIDFSIIQNGVEMMFGGEARVTGGIFYFKITTVPLVPRLQLAVAGIDLDPFIGKWFRFDPKEAGMSLQTMTREEEDEITSEIWRLFSQSPPFRVKAKLAGEKIDNKATYHYLLALDKENTKKFLLELVEISENQNTRPAFGIIDTAEISSQIDESFSKVGEIEFEIWIGQKDKYVYKIGIDKDFYGVDVGNGQMGNMALDFEMVFSEFNQPRNITAPENSDNIIGLLMPFFQIPKVFYPTGLEFPE